MVQIEELGKVIAQLILSRKINNDAARKTEAIQQVYTSLNTDPDFLLEASPETIFAQMDEGGRSGLLRMEMAAKTLVEDSFLNPVKKEQLLRKAKQLLEYIQMHDNTFSLERLEKISEIDSLLS
ncbi:hypothetical protein [Parabacteroides pacaensis]|uniref:hypothetical protein n=1 Tax=Parabacteroides pacaensis TaxID=2086575 RepID=UPI001F437BC7|nr:hypothetical protein [Parabacteroides pacaensis]